MAASPHLCLRWNNYQSNLTSVFDQLLQNETFVDVTLAADGHAIKAHRMVLSACSPYFQALFFDNPCQHPIVILKDTRWSELKAIVEYMYRGEISVAQEELSSLLRVAETLKIRGLSELNNSERRATEAPDDRSDSASPLVATAITSATPTGLDNRRTTSPSTSWPQQQQPANWSREETPTPSPRPTKRRRGSVTERSTPGGSPAGSTPASVVAQQHEEGSLEGPLSLVGHAHSTSANVSAFPQQQQQQQPAPVMQPASTADDLDIKPGIAELIREEERARMLEGAHPWLTTSSSVLSDSYQYQLQALWQKAWATGQGVMQNLRFRERGPFKTWRPETMAEAIMAVLREGLSLSQAARKFDIPYPTFVLYANRVNNMLGPSSDGGSVHSLLAELRPKGRGRPQRILTGSWPEDHVHGVIRAVVFRDPTSLPRHFDREEPVKMTQRASGITRIGPSPLAELGGSSSGSSSNGSNSLANLRLNNNNGDFAMPSSSASYAANRSLAGPSTANGIEILANANAVNNGASNNQNQGAQVNCMGAPNNLGGGGLTSSSLFSVLQQEVAEETRLAALNAMTQRLMSSLDGEAIASLGMGGLPLSSAQQSRVPNSGPAGGGVGVDSVTWFPAANYSGAGAMDDVTGSDDVDGVEHLGGPYPGTAPNAIHVKQEQLFGE